MGRSKMKFFKRKKKKDLMVQVPLPVLIRQVIYDTMLMPAEDIADAMGLPPISDEVSEMEERASQSRLSRMSSLLPFIDTHAELCAKIATAAYLLEDDDFEASGGVLSEKDAQQIHNLFQLVSLSAAVSCVSTLFSLGLIESKLLGDKEEYDE